MRLCPVRWVLEEAPDASGDVALDAAGGCAVGLSFTGSSRDVGACGRVSALADEGHDVQGLVELAVTGPTEAVSLLVLTGGGLDRGGTGEAERGFAAASS